MSLLETVRPGWGTRQHGEASLPRGPGGAPWLRRRFPPGRCTASAQSQSQSPGSGGQGSLRRGRGEAQDGKDFILGGLRDSGRGAPHAGHAGGPPGREAEGAGVGKGENPGCVLDRVLAGKAGQGRVNGGALGPLDNFPGL